MEIVGEVLIRLKSFNSVAYCAPGAHLSDGQAKCDAVAYSHVALTFLLVDDIRHV